MNQKVDNLQKGDLVTIQGGWNKWNYVCVFDSCKILDNVVISVSYYIFSRYKNSKKLYKEHIRTRNSDYQRIYKIYEDNLNSEDLKIYEEIKNKLLNE